MDNKTFEFYSTRGAEWAEHLRNGWRPQLDSFLDRLATGARILELGCGDGRDAARMIERGFNVHPTDGVPEMARMASERLGREVDVLPFDRLEAQEAYDAVWAHASLLHVEQAELPGILKRVHRALRPGGWHFANYKGGTGGHRDKFGRYYNYMSEAGLRDAYEAAATWSSFEIEASEGGGFDGVRLTWLAVTVRR